MKNNKIIVGTALIVAASTIAFAAPAELSTMYTDSATLVGDTMKSLVPVLLAVMGVAAGLFAFRKIYVSISRT